MYIWAKLETMHVLDITHLYDVVCRLEHAHERECQIVFAARVPSEFWRNAIQPLVQLRIERCYIHQRTLRLRDVCMVWSLASVDDVLELG